MASIQKSSKINMYKFVNTDDQGAAADPVAKSINVQTQALNNMGRTLSLIHISEPTRRYAIAVAGVWV